ncbi:hypothetical protein BDR03DRAFT_1012613 [Suillus americanus]|nr:hypothetical protein BDR03DRAFT_1012613 [Suillus americanus]
MTPSPEPEERPSLLVKAPTLPKEVEESFEARALRIWAGLRERLDTLIKVMPDDDPALFVDRESWTRDWNELLELLSEVGMKSANEGVTLELDDEGLAQLAEGKRAYRTFSCEIRDMKSKVIAEPAPSTPPRARLSQAKLVPEVTAPAKKDTEEKLVMHPGARMSVPKAPCCTRCSEGKLMCGGQPGKRCSPCNKGKKLCLFSRVRKVPKKVPVARRKAESAPDMPMASASMSGTVPPTVSSPALDVMEIYSSGSGESEVEEEEEWIRGLCTIPNHAIKPLPACTGMLSKASVSKAPTDIADGPEGKLVRLKAENEHLKSIILGMRQNSRAQQSRLITFSNQLYSMSQEMSCLDTELSFLD